MRATLVVTLLWAAAVLACGSALWLYDDSTGLQPENLVGIGFVMGIPLPLVIPLIYLPLLGRLDRLLRGALSRWWVLPLAGAAFALPLVAWTIELGSDDVQGALMGAPGSRERLIQNLTPHLMWPYYLLYGFFGALLGLWQAVSGSAAPSQRATGSH